MASKSKTKFKRGQVFEIEISEVHTHYSDDKKPYSIYRVKGFNSLFLDDYALQKLVDQSNERHNPNKEA